MLASKQIAFGKAAGAAKPYKARLEYLESTGTQYIDTGIYASNTLKTRLRVRELIARISMATFGVFEDSKCYYLYQSGGGGYNGNWQVGFGEFSNTSARVDTSAPHEFLFDNFVVYCDGVAIHSFAPSTFTSSHTLLLFNMHNASGGVYSAVAKRVYECKMWESGVLVQSLIPVLDNDLVPCMYDEVSGEFFYNQGTGEFIAGPEI